jgi:hypothetical protein
MKHDYSDYTDEEIENRLNGIKVMLDENIDELGKSIRMEISDETRKCIINVIGKTNQMLDYWWEDSKRKLENSYQKLSPKMKEQIPK